MRGNLCARGDRKVQQRLMIPRRIQACVILKHNAAIVAVGAELRPLITAFDNLEWLLQPARLACDLPDQPVKRSRTVGRVKSAWNLEIAVQSCVLNEVADPGQGCVPFLQDIECGLRPECLREFASEGLMLALICPPFLELQPKPASSESSTSVERPPRAVTMAEFSPV